MNRSPSKAPRLLALLAVVTIVTTGCVQPGSPKVGISRIEAQLVFGVKPEPEKIPTPVTSTETLEPTANAPKVADFGTTKPPSSSFTIPPSDAPVEECPAAPRGAPAERVASVNVTNDPDVGLYKWKTTVSAKGPDGKPATREEFGARILRRFKRIDTGHFSYETVQPNGAGKFLVSYYDVYTNKLRANTTSPVGIVDAPTSGGDPLRGLVLTRTETHNAAGLPDGPSFTPRDGVLLLPLPVTAGENYQSVAVDPKGASIVHRATVRRVQRIDACGAVVDGWLVEATQTITAATGGSSDFTYSYLVAPQYGAILLNEHIVPADKSFDLTFQLAQLKPSPLPSGAS